MRREGCYYSASEMRREWLLLVRVCVRAYMTSGKSFTCDNIAISPAFTLIVMIIAIIIKITKVEMEMEMKMIQCKDIKVIWADFEQNRFILFYYFLIVIIASSSQFFKSAYYSLGDLFYITQPMEHCTRVV